MRPGQLPECRPTADIRHRGQAEVDPVRENGGQQRFIVPGRSPAPLMVKQPENPVQRSTSSSTSVILVRGIR